MDTRATRGYDVEERKTDRDDALKLAKLAALGQLVPVYVPPPESRQYRRLTKYRKTLVGRINRVQNGIRALHQHQGLSMPTGFRAWTAEGIEWYRSLVVTHELDR